MDGSSVERGGTRKDRRREAVWGSFRVACHPSGIVARFPTNVTAMRLETTSKAAAARLKLALVTPVSLARPECERPLPARQSQSAPNERGQGPTDRLNIVPQP